MGVAAAISLVVYGLLSYAVLVWLGATLTLPGIAGFVLAIGMAVDANVLVYERAKEEYAVDPTLGRSLGGGFQRALERHSRRQRHHPPGRGPALLPRRRRGPWLRRDPHHRGAGVDVLRPRGHPGPARDACRPGGGWCAAARLIGLDGGRRFREWLGPGPQSVRQAARWLIVSAVLIVLAVAGRRARAQLRDRVLRRSAGGVLHRPRKWTSTSTTGSGRGRGSRGRSSRRPARARS